MKKIYFAGSIRGGRVDADLYKQIISHLQHMGHKVLTMWEATICASASKAVTATPPSMSKTPPGCARATW